MYCSGQRRRSRSSCRQGRVLRHRRHLAEASRRHGRHEVGRWGAPALLPARCAPLAAPQGAGANVVGVVRPGREHARRQCPVPGRRGQGACRARPSRSSIATPRAASSGDAMWYAQEKFKPQAMVELLDAEPRHHRRLAGLRARRSVQQQHRAVQQAARRGLVDRREAVAHAARAELRAPGLTPKLPT